MTETTFAITRAPAWDTVVGRLDAAVAKEPTLAAAREVVVRPVELLRLMAAETPGALGDDVLAADRLRMLLFLAWPFASRVEESRGLSSPPKPVKATTATTNTTPPLPPPAAYEPGVLDHGALVIVALAAVRVAPPQMAELFLRTVHGLALAAAPAEVLGRLDPESPEGDALAVILDTLYLFDSVGSVTNSPLLRPFVADPVERGRWRCLEELIGNGERAQWLREQVANAQKELRLWGGAYSDGISKVEPDRARPGESMWIRGEKGMGVPTHVRVVFASADGEPLVAKVASVKTSSSSEALLIEVIAPEGLRAGWVGFSDDNWIRRSNEHRKQVISRIQKVLLDSPCLRGSPPRVDQIPMLDRQDPERATGLIAVPPRTGTNRVRSGLPALVSATLSPERVAPGESLTLTWESAFADAVRLEPGGERLPPRGTKALSAPDTEQTASFILTPVARWDNDVEVEGPPVTVSTWVKAPLRITAVDVTQGGLGQPFRVGAPLDVAVMYEPEGSEVEARLRFEPRSQAEAGLLPVEAGRGRVRFTLDAKLLRNELTFTVELSDDEAGVDDQATRGPYSFETIRRGSVVVILPSVLELNPHPERVVEIDPLRASAAGAALDTPGPELPALTLDAAQAAIARAARELGLELQVHELPWQDDGISVLLARPSDRLDPYLDRLLEKVSRRALLTPGFERALWLMLLPGSSSSPHAEFPPVNEPLWRQMPATAARAVAVADVGGLPSLLAEVFAAQSATALPQLPTQALPRLRLLGSLDDDGLHLETVRQEKRQAGYGAPLECPIVAVTTDRLGRARVRVPLHCYVKTRPMQVELLLPVAPEVCAVELREGDLVIARLVRTLGEPSVSEASLTQEQLTWAYEHSRGARAELMVEVVRGDVTTPAIRIDARQRLLDFPRRFRRADGLVLQASDGWNVAVRPLQAEIDNPTPVVLRRLSDGRFWADVPGGWTARWMLDGKELGVGRSLWLKPSAAGLLELEASSPEASKVTDCRELIPGEPW